MLVIPTFLFLLSVCLSNLLSTTVNVSPLTAASVNTTYTFSFLDQSNSTLPVATSLFILFPTPVFSISSVSSCSLTINQINIGSVGCSVNATNQLQFASINTSPVILNNFTVSFQTSGALYVSTPQVQFYFVDGDGINVTVGSCIFSISPAIMGNCTISSNDTRVGSSSSWTLSFTPSVNFQMTNTLKVTIPKWGPFNQTNFVSSPVCSQGACSNSSSSGSQYLTVTNLVSVATSSTQSFSIMTLKNPSSTLPVTLTLQIFSSTNLVQTCSANLAPSVPNVLNVQFNIPNRSISATNSIVAVLSLTNPLPSNGYISINTPLGLTYSYTDQGESGTPVATSILNNTLLLGNLSSTAFSYYQIGNFVLISPQSVAPVRITITTLVMANGSYYTVDQAQFNVVCVPSIITSYSVNFTPQNANQIANYSLTFQTVNQVIINSFVTITFPTQTNIQSSSVCSSALGSCTVNPSTNSINLTLTASTPGSSNVSVLVSNVLNPYTTITSSSFAITTYYNSSSSQVDNLTSGMTITAQPNVLSSLLLTASNLTVSATSIYTFQFTFANPVLQQSTINIVFPNSVGISALGVVNSSCQLNTSGQSITLSGCFVGNSTQQFNVSLGGVVNPTSTQTTSTFNATLVYQSKLLEYLMTALTLTTTSLATLSFGVTPSNSTVHATTPYTFTVTFSQKHVTGDQLTISVPTEAVLQSNPFCTAIYGVSTVSCSTMNGNLTVSLVFTAFPVNYTIQFGVQNITNVWHVSTGTFGMTSSTAGGFLMEQGSSSMTTTVGSLNVSVSSDQNIVLLGPSSIRISVTPPFQITSPSLQLTIQLPPNYLNATSCTSSYGSCAITSNNLTLTNINPLQSILTITVNAQLGYFSTTTPFPVSLFDSTSNISSATTTVSVFCSSQCKQCLSNQTSCLSCLPAPYTQLVLYVPSTFSCVSQCPSTTFLSGMNCLPCSTNCYNCTSNSTNCVSCPNPTSNYLYNNTCYSNCPSTTYSNGLICSPCSSMCKDCLSFDLCTSCQPPLVLYQQTCISSCPSGTTDVAGSCVSCSKECLTCQSLTTNCTSCLPLMFKYLTTCLDTCPNGTFGYNGICGGCIPPCNSCSGSADNCTSCITGYLYNNICTSNCPGGYYVDTNNQCQSCGNCYVCTNPVDCTQCRTGYYLVDKRCYETCPSTYPIPQGNTCLACDTSCQTCEGLTSNCTSCSNGTFLLSNNCLQSCPTGYSANAIHNTCDGVQSSMIYFPGVFSGVALALVAILSRFLFKSTSLVTCLVALLAVPQTVVYCYYISLLVTHRINSSVSLALGIVSLLLLVSLSIMFLGLIVAKSHTDQYYQRWYKQYRVMSWIISACSIFNFKVYRLSYSRMFNLEGLGSCFKDSRLLLVVTTATTVANILLVQIMMIVSCVTAIYSLSAKDQLFFEAIDCIIVSSLLCLCEVIDIPKQEHYFVNSPFLNNKVYNLDNKNSVDDQVNHLDGQDAEGHSENCQRKGGQLVYKLNSGCYFQDSEAKIKLGDESVTQGYNAQGMVPLQSQSIQNMDQLSHQGEVPHLKQEERESSQLPQQVSQKRQVDEVKEANEITEQLQFQDDDGQALQSCKTRYKSPDRYMKQKRININIFDPIEQLTEEELLNQLQSLQSVDEFKNNRGRLRSLSKSPQDTRCLQNRSTVSVFNKKDLKKKWNNIIHGKVQNLKSKKQECLKPLPISAINQISQTSSQKGMYRRRKLTKPPKYHNKELEQIYLQRIVPATKLVRERSLSAKPGFRSNKYKS